MTTDMYGRQTLSEQDVCDLYLQDPERVIKRVALNSTIRFDPVLELENVPKITINEKLTLTISEYDIKLQDIWFMPDEYANMDIAKYVLDLCETDYELQRVGEELIKYQELEMFPMLRYCKYLVDTMRKHNIVWGVGRGSSVSSYVLFLIGIHRINSLHFDLSIDEFLK